MLSNCCDWLPVRYSCLLLEEVQIKKPVQSGMRWSYKAQDRTIYYGDEHGERR